MAPKGHKRAFARLNIDEQTLTGEPIWAVAREPDEIELYQEDPDREELRGGDVALIEYKGEMIVKIGMEEERTYPDEWNGGYTNERGYPLINLRTGTEIDWFRTLPSNDNGAWTPLDMIM